VLAFRATSPFGGPGAVGRTHCLPYNAGMSGQTAPFPGHTPGRGFLTRWGPFLVPPLYLALIFGLQPPDRLSSTPDRAPWLNRAVYDDWDLAALALRGLNASLGRTPGRTDNPEQIDDEEYSRLLDEPLPLRRQYFLEYPPAALLLFRLPYGLFPLREAPPAALCDGSYGNIVMHRPRTDRERRLWQTFRRVTRTYQVLLCLGVLLLLTVIRVGYEPGGGLSGPLVLLILPAALYFSLNRFDLVPALLTAVGLACLGRRRCLASGLLFGAAAAMKVYPALLAPLVFHYLWPGRRDAWGWLLGFAAALAACYLPPLALSGGQAVWQPFALQLTRPPLGPTAYGYLLPLALAANDLGGRLFRLGTVVLVVLLLAWRRPPDLAGLLRRGAIALVVFLALPVFYSPQWVIWLLPLLVPLARGHRLLAWLIAALDLVTFATFPYAGLGLPDAVWVYARFAILAALVAVLARDEWRRRPGSVLRPGRGVHRTEY
jgi:hypothetical protein